MRSSMSTHQAKEVNYDSLRDQQRDNNALKQRVEMLREQASINMKMALMKVPETWSSSL